MNGVEAARRMLDELQVQARLEHIRDYLWRGGAVELRCEPACVAYVLSAEWDTPVLSPVSTDEGLVAISTPVVEGRWRRARTGYHLWVGIDAHVLTAIAVQAPHLRSYVPFVDRSADEIARALDARLAEYGQTFLDQCLPVPQAQAEAAARLRRLGL